MVRVTHVCANAFIQVPYKNGNNKQATPNAQVDHEYEPVNIPVNKTDSHYKVSHS